VSDSQGPSWPTAGRTHISGSQGVQTGSGNTQINVPITFAGDQPSGPVIAGNVPLEPPSFQLRTELMNALERHSEESGDDRPSIAAITGIRGTGKTQVAAAYARRRMKDGWRLIAWVNAADETTLLSGLAEVAAAAGIADTGAEAKQLALRVRHWLEADGDRRLLVFDNVGDPVLLRDFLPAGGSAQVIVTSGLRSAADLGSAVEVQVEQFSDEEALAFLAARTGLDDQPGALAVARELGHLPLGLAQAATVISQDHLDNYQQYLERLGRLRVAKYMRQAGGDPYPHQLAEAIELSLRALRTRDPSGLCERLMGLMAVLTETGIDRRMLHHAARTGLLGINSSGVEAEAEVDTRLGNLVDASLLVFTTDRESVSASRPSAHRLVMRVVRERLAGENGLASVFTTAVEMLLAAGDAIEQAWSDPAMVRDLAGQVSAVNACAADHPDDVPAEITPDLLDVRLRSAYLLNELRGNTDLAIMAAKPLAEDCEQILGPEAPKTLAARDILATAYQEAGFVNEAIGIFWQVLDTRERTLREDDPDILASRNNLATTYLQIGRSNEAIPILQRTLADRGRVLGPKHLDTLTSRNNLAVAYWRAGQADEAVPRFEQVVADSRRFLGVGHRETLAAQNNLAAIYQNVRRTEDSIRLSEQAITDCERELGPSNLETLLARRTLALAYQDKGLVVDAIHLLGEVSVGLGQVLGLGHPYTVTTREKLAELTG
jgi:tetratricopeptide (TPR) repeat protein